MKREASGFVRKEDYLRVIYELYEEKGIKGVELSRNLKISKASVSEMLRKLSKEGLIKIQPYSKILLTGKGKKEAEKLFDKYYTIKSFIKKFLKHGNEKAKDEAHRLEHAFSQESVEIISKIMEEGKNELKITPNYVG